MLIPHKYWMFCFSSLTVKWIVTVSLWLKLNGAIEKLPELKPFSYFKMMFF